MNLVCCSFPFWDRMRVGSLPVVLARSCRWRSKAVTGKHAPPWGSPRALSRVLPSPGQAHFLSSVPPLCEEAWVWGVTAGQLRCKPDFQVSLELLGASRAVPVVWDTPLVLGLCEEAGVIYCFASRSQLVFFLFQLPQRIETCSAICFAHRLAGSVCFV